MAIRKKTTTKKTKTVSKAKPRKAPVKKRAVTTKKVKTTAKVKKSRAKKQSYSIHPDILKHIDIDLLKKFERALKNIEKKIASTVTPARKKKTRKKSR